MGMLKTSLIALLGIAVASALIVNAFQTEEVPIVPGTTKAQSTSSSNASGGSSTATSTDKVSMKDIAYSPATIRVAVGTTVTWTNDDPIGHTVTPVDAEAWGNEGSGSEPAKWLQQGQTYTHTFTKEGTYQYYCVPHAAKGSDGTFRGMVGTVIVGGSAGDVPAAPAFSMPTNVVTPSPVAPERSLPGPDGMVHLELTTKEVVAKLADGTAYTFWTFDGTVPGPMLRVRVGDTVMMTIHNDGNSTQPHSIDLHAVTGPGGGAVVTQTKPGESTTFQFKALNPGLYIYHCATPHIPSHIANGMYGMILVEPEGGLPKVDREYYIVQGELYTTQRIGTQGLQQFSLTDLLDEKPEYFLFNGAVNALTGEGALKAKVGETVRLYVGVGGFVPSNFHVIGEIFDRAHSEGASETRTNVQTTIVPAGGATWVEFKVEVPGNYLIVDHTLVHSIDRGAVGILTVEGEEDPEVFQGTATEGSGH